MDNDQSGNSPIIFKKFDSVKRVKLDSGDQCVLILSGWCFSPSSRDPMRIEARLNGNMVSTFVCDVERPDLQSHFDDDLTQGSSIPYCGFHQQLDLNQSTGIVELTWSELGEVIERFDLESLDRGSDTTSQNQANPAPTQNSNLINQPPKIFKNIDLMKIDQPDPGGPWVLVLSGWCFSPASGDPIKIEARLNGTLVSTFVCDAERPDLKSHFGDDLTQGSSIPYCGFYHQMDLEHPEGAIVLACEELGVVVKKIILENLVKETESGNTIAMTPSWSIESNDV